MRMLFSLVIVSILTSVSYAQPPWADQGKFGIGKGHFGNPEQMMEMRQRMREALIDKDDKMPGLPPWAGMHRGPRGPQAPFWAGKNDCPRFGCPQCPWFGKCPKMAKPNGKGKVSNNHFRHHGKDWKHNDNKHRGQKSFKGQKPGGDNKSFRQCPSCWKNFARGEK